MYSDAERRGRANVLKERAIAKSVNSVGIVFELQVDECWPQCSEEVNGSAGWGFSFWLRWDSGAYYARQKSHDKLHEHAGGLALKAVSSSGGSVNWTKVAP